MRLPTRVYVSLGVALAVATFGTGQIWGLGVALRSGTAGVTQVALGGLGLVLLLASGLVLGRLLYVLTTAPRARRAQGQEVSIPARRHYDEVR